MSRFHNSKKNVFIDEKQNTSITADRDTLTTRCKFNFSYFTKQANAGQDFCDWTREELVRLLDTLKEYSRQPLSYWASQQRGRGKTLAIYDKFPPKSDFEPPAHVPDGVAWGRFRLTGSVRLVGFKIPTQFHGESHGTTKVAFDCNTFYVVFLDRDHRFWLGEDD